VTTIANLVDVLGDEFDFWIITSDRDFMDTTPYKGITLDEWGRVGKTWVYYASPKKQGFLNWAHLMKETPHDVVYLNSLFDPVFTLRPLLANKFLRSSRRPVILAPRGELYPGALGLKSWKKMPFLGVARIVGLYRNVLWQASTDDEAQLICQKFGMEARVVVAKNLFPLTKQTPVSSNVGKLPGPLRVVFLSRIARKKNLDFALSVISRCDFAIHLDIWGPLEDTAYWRECQDLIQAVPDHIVVRYRGVADHSEVTQILSQYDLFFLPTRGENYGHVIVEALLAGTPVLLTDKTPWRNLEQEAVGWDLPLEAGENLFLKTLEDAAKMIPNEREVWRKRTRKFALKLAEDPDLVESNRALFLLAIGRKCDEHKVTERA
jgi:glycosyltransferase involved in cell wall biosynthesis